MVKIFYDAETTGTNYLKHSMHQLAGLVELDGEVVQEFDIKLRPHPKALLDPGALRIGGVTEEQLKAYPPMEEGLQAFIKIVQQYIDPYDKNTRGYLVGYNNRAFDDKFLEMLFDLCGNSYLRSYFWTDTLDVMVLASEYLIPRRASMPSFKLKRVATELGLEYNKEKLHGGLYDAQLTRQIYRIVTGLDYEL